MAKRAQRSAIDSAVFDGPCTGPISLRKPPENGHTLILTVSAETSPSATEDPLNSYGFSWIDKDGSTSGGSGFTDSMIGCIASQEGFPLFGPGQKGIGKIALDVSSIGGILIYRLNSQATHGYEWVLTPSSP